MDKQEIKASILRSVEQEIDAWLDVEPKITDAFEYEKTLFDRTMRIGRLMLENSRGKPPKDRNKKKTVLTIFGRVALSKSHMLQHSAFKVTTYMQSMICLLSQNVVFSEASSLLKELLNVSLSAKQCQRVSQWYGDQINPIINANQIDFIPQLSPPKKDDICYVMMDGCMLYTRDDGWKENKLARIFYDRENIKIQENRNEIVNTVYVSHLGGIDKFLPKLERHTALLKTPKVFIADGAKWIWNWVDDSYPGCVQILDYYHAVEKLEAFAKIQFSDQTKRKEWMAIQKELLLKDRVEDVILNIRKTRSVHSSAKELKMKVIRYYVEHEDRMQYKTFRDKGLLIGSGPMEAAHRNVTQQRMKLSGQKWSIKGANAIANLRCYQKSNKWGIINDLIKIAA